MFERRGPTYTDYGSDAPRQRLRTKWWLATGGASSSPSWPSSCFAFGEPAPTARDYLQSLCDPATPPIACASLRTSDANRARDDQWQIVVQLMASRGIMPPRATSSLGTNELMDQTDAHAGGRPASLGMPRSASGGYQARRSTSGDRERAARMPSSVAISPVCGVITILPCWAAERVCDLG